MHSKINPSTHLVFNGEIYNAEEIRKSYLPNEKLKTHADTEILVEALAIKETFDVLQAARGMFAIGNYNSNSQKPAARPQAT
jgi:asparagine synthetase B (glutamine-hydrolysing)